MKDEKQHETNLTCEVIGLRLCMLAAVILQRQFSMIELVLLRLGFVL